MRMWMAVFVSFAIGAIGSSPAIAASYPGLGDCTEPDKPAVAPLPAGPSPAQPAQQPIIELSDPCSHPIPGSTCARSHPRQPATK